MERYIAKSIAFILTLTLLLNSAQLLCMFNNNSNKEEIIEIQEKKTYGTKDETAKKAGLFKKVPHEVIYEILQFANTTPLLHLGKTCKHLQKTIKKITLKKKIKSLCLGNTNMSEKNIKKLVQEMKKIIDRYGILLFKYKTISGKKKIKNLHHYNYTYHLYKTIKKEIASQIDVRTKKSSLLLRILQTSTCISIGSLIILFCLIIQPPGVIMLCDAIIKRIGSGDIPEIIYLIASAFVTFVAIMMGLMLTIATPQGSLFLTKKLTPLTKKISDYITRIILGRLYGKHNLEKIILGIKKTKKIKLALQDLKNSEKTIEEHYNKAIYEKEAITIRNMPHNINNKLKEKFQSIKTMIRSLRTVPIYTKNKWHNITESMILDCETKSKALIEILKKIELQQKADTNKLLKKYKSLLLKKLNKEIALEKKKSRAKRVNRRIVPVNNIETEETEDELELEDV